MLLIGGLVAFYSLDGQLSKLPRLAILLAGTGAAAALTARTAFGTGIWAYLQGARVEMRKVVWPTRQESVQTTLVIAVFVVIVAAFMSLVDWGLSHVVQLLIGKGNG
ncbi:MAG: preprotein translocase subunit SecE [Nevskia sp.]|nr:preprotein translocase subunit SecE [Nevskia sp.]